MASRTPQRPPTASPPAEPHRWRPSAHDLTNALLALSLQLELVGMATGHAERSRHLEAARQALFEGESRLRALHQAIQLEDGARGLEAARRTLTESESRLRALRQLLQRLDAPAPRPERTPVKRVR